MERALSVIQPDTPVRQRQPRVYSEAREARRVLSIIRPFLKPVGRWNEAAAQHTAILASCYSSELDRYEAYGAIREMIEDVHESRAAFSLATATAPNHGFVEDVRMSMERLEMRLSEAAAYGRRHLFEPARRS